MEDFIILPEHNYTDNGEINDSEEVRSAYLIAEAKRHEDPDNIIIVSAKSISDARDQMLKYQKDGKTVDSIMFDGGHGSPGEMEFKNGNVEYEANKETMTEFFGLPPINYDV